ncbi:fungal hydrophobin [Lentinula raphanica]|nr:fungal hydrophobin [Lentinula raphanica]KAJ3820702.1 fungal hydrophobin [Lentinula raphanica]KAJ3968387.1 fungal hydrophobin [Lentinula raphanica]
MFSRISSIAFYALFAFAILAAATPGGVKPTTTLPPVTTTITVTAPATTTTITSGSCTTGPIQCCDSTETAGSSAGSSLLGLLGIVIEDLNVLLGINCSPITIIGASGSSCSAQTVCCEDNAVGGLISIGCIPIFL